MRIGCITTVLLVVVLSAAHFTQAQNDSFLPSGLDPITAANAAQLEQLAALGAGTVDAIVWSPDGEHIAAFGRSGTWLFRSNNISQPDVDIQAHTMPITYAAFSPDSRLIATGSDDGVTISDVDTGAPVSTFDSACGFVAFSPDGRWLVTGSKQVEESTMLWDITSGDLIAQLEGSDLARLVAVSFSSDGNQMAAAYESLRWPYMNAINVWNTRTWDAVLQIPTSEYGGIRSISFSGSDTQLLLCTANSVAAWDVRDGQNLAQTDPLPCVDESSDMLSTFGITPDAVWGETVSPDRSRIAFIDADGALEIGVYATTRRIASAFAFSAPVMEIAFSPDDRWIAALERGYDGTAAVRLWDLKQTPLPGTAVIELDGQQASTSSLSFLSDRELMIADRSSGHLRIWDTGAEALIADYQIEVDEQSALAVSPDLSTIAVFHWQDDSTGEALLHMQTWDLSSGTLLSDHSSPGSREHPPTVLREARYAPNGDVIATAGHSAHLWRSDTGQEVALLYDYTFPEGQWEIDNVVFSPDGQLLVAEAAFPSSLIYVWDVQRAIETQPLTAQDPMANTGSLVAQLSHMSGALLFSPDGSLLISGAYGSYWGDSTIKVWNTRGWEQTSILRGHTDSIYTLAMASDGTLLASAGIDGTIRFWGVEPDN